MEFFHHNPSDGTTEDDVKYRGVYESTKAGLLSFFGSINPYAWPSTQVRFSVSYKWYSHPDFIRKTSAWNSVQNQNFAEIEYSEMILIYSYQLEEHFVQLPSPLDVVTFLAGYKRI